MPKRPDTHDTTVLAIELLRLIPRGRKITAVELHQQLCQAGIKRELRTIQRQLNMLLEHFEIERDERSKPYGYRWLEHAQPLAVPTLSPQESLLLKLAEQQLRHLLPARLMTSMGVFFNQAGRNLHHDPKAQQAREWMGKVRVVATNQPLLPPELAPGVFEVVSEALYCNHWLKLDYRNAAGKQSEVEFMPLGLAQQGPRLYLVGRYQGYDNERNLALHRIQSATMLGRTFERPRDFDLKQYDDNGRFAYGDGTQVRLSFRIDYEAGMHLLESPLSTDQQAIHHPDDTLEISATVVDSAMLTWWLRGFGEAVREVRMAVVGDTPNVT